METPPKGLANEYLNCGQEVRIPGKEHSLIVTRRP